MTDPTPESRELRGAAGVPAVLADGRCWLLFDAGLGVDAAVDALRDKIDDDARLAGEVAMMDVAEAAGHLLLANYDLSVDEARTLLAGADHQPLAEAVQLALFGPAGGRRTYTTWAASAMLANGIDPASVPAALRPHVLNQLEAAKRCIPRSEYIESAEAARRFAGLRARAARPAPAPAPAPDLPADPGQSIAE